MKIRHDTTTYRYSHVCFDNDGEPIGRALKTKTRTKKKYIDITTDDAVAILDSNYDRIIEFLSNVNGYSIGIIKFDTYAPRKYSKNYREEIIKNNVIRVSEIHDTDKVFGDIGRRIKHTDDGGYEISINNLSYYVIRNADTEVAFIPREKSAIVIENGVLRIVDKKDFIKMILEIIERNEGK